MDTHQIIKYCSSIPSIKKIFGGCIPLDYLKFQRFSTFPRAIVVNTCNSKTKEFSNCHWILLYLTKSSISVFDSSSFNSYLFFPEIRNFVRSQQKLITANAFGFQNLSSQKCGHYVCIFVYCLSKKISIRKLVKYFKKNINVNDLLVDKLFNCFFVKKESKCLNKKT